MNLFQSLVLAVFALLAIAAVILFSVTQSGGGAISFAGDFKVWGTLPAESLAASLDDFNSANGKSFRVDYVEKKKDTLESELVSALASGDGPDLVILPENLIVRNTDKIVPISYDSYPIRNFNDDFADVSSIFMSDNGIIGMPLYIDPLVMYWDKDIFSTGGVASYPTRWSEFEGLAGRLTQSDSAGNISQATVAMGGFGNVQYAKDIIAALFLQSGNGLVRRSLPGETDQFGSKASYHVLLGSADDTGGLVSALNFFLDFSNPAKKAYSWNVALPNSEQAFAGGTLAVYLGHGSDYGAIQKINPHLNFSVALLPQRDNVTGGITFANVYGVAVTKGAKNPAVASQIAIAMSGADFEKSLSQAIALPPARRDLLSLGSKNPVASVLDSSAIMSRSWLDPSPADTDQIFNDMIESVLSGSSAGADAVNVAGQRLNNLIKTNKTAGLKFNPALAAIGSLVPCGGTGQNPCQFTDLATLFNNVMNFLLYVVLVPAATLAIAFVGIQYLTAAGNPSKLSKAHEILMDVLYGIFIALAAYAIIETIFIVLTNYGKLPSISG